MNSVTQATALPATASALVGQVTWRGAGTVRARDFQRWALAVGDLNPLYFDPAVASAQGHPALVMPPMFLPMVVRPLRALSDLRPDGSVPEYDLPGLPPRRMAGGEESTFHRAVHDGETLSAERILTDVVAKQGRSGAFLLATWTTTYSDERAERVAVTSFRLVAR